MSQAVNALKEARALSDLSELRIWLGGQLCRVVMTTPIDGARDREELDAALTAALRSRGLARKEEVAHSMSLTDEKTAIAVALIHTDALDAIKALSRSGVSVRSIRPWWSSFVEEFVRSASAQGRPQVFAAFDEETLTTVTVDPADDIRLMATHDVGSSLAAARKVMTRLTSLEPNCHAFCVSLTAPLDPSTVSDGESTRGAFGFTEQVVISETF
ncbi:MAG: hypothetical protein K2X42_01030 [Burkholderiaceae bacterium]|nr:hypothetical protein [Burkholderiaceae bacterium]